MTMAEFGDTTMTGQSIQSKDTDSSPKVASDEQCQTEDQSGECPCQRQWLPVYCTDNSLTKHIESCVTAPKTPEFAIYDSVKLKYRGRTVRGIIASPVFAPNNTATVILDLQRDMEHKCYRIVACLDNCTKIANDARPGSMVTPALYKQLFPGMIVRRGIDSPTNSIIIKIDGNDVTMTKLDGLGDIVTTDVKTLTWTAGYCEMRFPLLD